MTAKPGTLRCMKYRLLFCHCCYSHSWGCAVYGTQELAFSEVLDGGVERAQGAVDCYKRSSAVCLSYSLHFLAPGMTG